MQGEGVGQQQTSTRYFINQNIRGQASKEKNNPNGQIQAKQSEAKMEIGNVTNNYKIQINPRENRESSGKKNNKKNIKKNKEYLLPQNVQQSLLLKNTQSPSKPGAMNESITEKFQQTLPIGKKANNFEIHTNASIRNSSQNVLDIVTSRKKQIFSAGFNILNHKLQQEVKESYQASEISDQNQTKNVSNLENFWSLTNLRITNQLSQPHQLQNLQSLKFSHHQKMNIQQKQHNHKVVNDGTMNISEHVSEQSNDQKTIKKNVPHFNFSLEKNTNRKNVSKQKTQESHQKLEDINKQFNITINLSRSLSNLAKNSSQNSDKNIEKQRNKIQQMNEIEKIEYKQNSMINQNDFTCLSLLKKIDDKFDEHGIEGEEYDENERKHRRMCSTDEKVEDQMPINIQSSIKTQTEGHHEWALKIEKSSQQAIINQEQTCKPVHAASKKKGPLKNLKSSEKKHDKKMKMAQVPGSMISANDKYNKKNIAQKLPTVTANSHFLLANSMNSGDNSNQITKRNKLKQQEQLKNQNPQSKNKMKFNHMDLSKILNDIGQQNTIQSSVQMRKKDNQDHNLDPRKSESPKQPTNKESIALKKEKINLHNQSQDKIQLQNQIKTFRQTELNRVINQVKKGTPSSQINLNNHFALEDKKYKLVNEERSTSLKRKQWSQMNSQKLGNSVEIPFQPVEINLFPLKSQKMSVITHDQPLNIKNPFLKEPKESDVQQLNSMALDISKSISQIINQPILQIKEQYYKKQKSNQVMEARQINLIDEPNHSQSNLNSIMENQKQIIKEEKSKQTEELYNKEGKTINDYQLSDKILIQQTQIISNQQSIYLQNQQAQSNETTNDINSLSQQHLIKNQISSQDLLNNVQIQRPNTEIGYKDDSHKIEQKIFEKKSSLYEQILEMKNCQSQLSNNQPKHQNEQLYRLNLKQSIQLGSQQISVDQPLVRQSSKSSISLKNKNTNESVIERPLNINQINGGTNIQKKMFKKQSQLSLNDQDNNIYSATQIKSKKYFNNNHLRRQSVIDYTSQQNIIHNQIIKNNIQSSNKDYNKSAKVEKLGKNQQIGLKKNQSQQSIESKIIQSQTSQKKLQKTLSSKLKDKNVESYKNGKMKDKYKKLLKPSEEITYQKLIEEDNEYCDYSDKQQDYSHASPRQIVQWTNQNIQKLIINKNVDSNDKIVAEQFQSSKLNERRNYMSEEQKNSDKSYDSEKHVNLRLVPISGIAMLQKSRSPQFIKKVGLGQLMRQFELNVTPQKSPLQTKIQSTKNNSGKLQILESWITGEKDNRLLKQSNKSGQNIQMSHPKMESRKIGKIALEKEDQLEELNDEDMFLEGENLSSENLQINNKIFLHQKQKSIFQNREGNDRLSSQPPDPTEEDHPRKDALQSQLAIENILNSIGEKQNNRSLNSSCNFDEDDEHDSKQKDESQYYQDTKELDFKSQKKQRIEINQSSYSVAQQYANRPSKQSSQSIAMKYANRTKIDQNQKTLKKGKKHIQINLDLNSPQFDFIDDIQIENEKIPSDLFQGQLIKKSIQKKELRDLGFDQNREKNQFEKINEFTRNFNFLNNGMSSNKSMGQSVLNLSDPCKIYSPLTQNSNQQSFLDQKLKDILQKDQQLKASEKDQANKKTVQTPLQNKNTFIQIGTTPIQDFQNSTEIHRIMQISRRFGGASSAVLEDQRDFDKKKLYKADDKYKNEIFGQLQNNNIRQKNVKSVLSNKNIDEQKIMNNSIKQTLQIQNVNNQPEINKREQYFNIEQLNNSKKKQKSQTHLNNKKQNIIHKQNLPVVNSLLKNQSQYASQKELKSESILLNSQNLAAQNSQVFLQSDQINQTQVSINLSKSEIYKAKEEFIFVFGGVNIGSSKSKNTKAKTEKLSIEVIDILREISREFKNEQESDDEKQMIQINKNLSLPVSGFSATQFEFRLNNINCKISNAKDSQCKEKIYLIGGQDQYGNILDSVYEYSIKDMQIFQADWKLPFPTKDFALTKLTNLNSKVSSSIIIAGGVSLSPTKNEKLKTRNLSKNVYRIYQEKNSEQEQVLGIDMQSGLSIKYEQLPDMQKERSQFQLIFKQVQKNEFEIYAVGGIQDHQSDSSQLIEKYSSHNRKWEFVQVKFENKELSQQILCLKSHQSLFMPDGSILIVGGQVLEKNFGNTDQWKFTKNMIKFDTETNEMSYMPQMNQARGYFSLILSQSLRYIYVIGGLTNSKKKANKQVWEDLVNNSLVNQIDQDEDKELLTGIIRNTGCLNSIEKFDVFSKKWQLVAPLNQKRGMHASCQIYI